MPTVPSQLSFTEEVEASTIGDQVPTPPAGALALFPNQDGSWFSKSSAGTVIALAGITVVHNLDGTVTVSTVGSTTTISLPHVITAGGPTGSSSTVPVITYDAEGRLTAVTTATITPAAIGAQPAGNYAPLPVPLSDLSTETAYTLVGNATGSTAVPTALGVAAVNAMLASQEVVDVTQTSYNTSGHTVILGDSTLTTSTNNVLGLNSIAANAPQGSKLWFPTGICYLTGALTAFTKDFALEGVHGQSTICWVNTGVTTTNLITLCSEGAHGYYSSIRDLIFQTFVTMTGNYVIDCVNNVNTFIEGCIFTGGGADPFAGCIGFTDVTNGGNGAVVRGCDFEGWTDSAIYVHGALASPFFSDLEMIGNAPSLTTTNSANGILCDNGGAILMADCGIILCKQNLNITAASGKVVASIFAVNCFFDQGTVNSLLISGPGTVVRCHFLGCWFTSANSSGLTCIAITAGGAAIHEGIEFVGCWIVNVSWTGGGTTGTGISATSVADINVNGCQLGGWATGLSIAAAAGSVTSPVIHGNDIGAVGGTVANATGIALSGAMQSLTCHGNDLTGNTTPITDTSTVTMSKIVDNNNGANVTSLGGHNALFATTVTTAQVVPGLVFSIGANQVMQFTAVLAVQESATTTTDAVKVAISAPTGATGNYGVVGHTTTTGAAGPTETFGTLLQVALASTVATTPARLIVNGTITNGATAGTCAVEIAAAITTVTCTVQANSSIRAFQV